jgi:hypothetical protein
MKKLEEGAAHQLLMTTTCRVCFRKFFAAQIPHLPQLTVFEQRLFKDSRASKEHKKRHFKREIAL